LKLSLLPSALSQAVSVRRLHREQIGRLPKLIFPKSFNEKILHRRLFDRDSRIPNLIDKAKIKDFVRQQLGDEWITPSLYEGEDLPPLAERNWPVPFVVKATHGSHMNAFVRSPTDMTGETWREIEASIKKWKAEDYGRWPYTIMQKWILVEPFIGNGDPPADYKIFVFGGHAHYIQVDLDRFGIHKRVLFDRDWNKQPFTYRYPSDDREVERPSSLDSMIEAAETLGRDFSFVRVDFYEIDQMPRFGEMTFFPHSGLARFHPDEYDFRLGALWP